MQTPFQIPEGLTLETEDVSAGDWIDEQLLPLGGSPEGALVGEVIPAGFDAYARILHPAERRRGIVPGAPVSWAEVARERGKVIHPEVQFPALIGAELDHRLPETDEFWMPLEGSLPSELCPALLEILGRHTRTPDRCAFCLWDGFGFLHEGASAYLFAARGWRGRLQQGRMRREARRGARIERRSTRDVARVQIHPSSDRRGAFREYFLLRGPLESAATFVFDDGHFQSPNLWWPDDRRWVLATEIDDWTTYVGGSRACVDELLASHELEVVPSAPELRFDMAGDRINASELGR